MKNLLYLLFFIAVSYKATAQITYIPDQGFEQRLINLNIDSDGIINGQVLTSDVENVTELLFDFWNGPYIYNLTGIQDFSSLETLKINFFEITELDISQNLQLKELDCGNNQLTSIDVSSNILLEVLYIGNYDGDVGPFNMIEQIDLSNNPLIHTFDALTMSANFNKINLKNGNNNPNMVIRIGSEPWGWADPPSEPYGNICIEVDDVQTAQNNQYPYSEWTIYQPYITYSYTDDVEECSLNTTSFSQSNIKVYPNPVSDILYFDTAIEKVIVFDISGREILEQNEVSTISVSDLQKGSYLIKIFSDKGVQTKKILVK